ELLAPPIIRHLTHPDLADCIHHVLALRDQNIDLPQLRDDLFRLVSLPCHCSPPGCQRHTSSRTTSMGVDQRPLCPLPDGRGRHPTANVPGDSAAHRGTTATATTSASVRRSISCIQEQPSEGVRPNARENGQIRPSTKRSGYPRCC